MGAKKTVFALAALVTLFPIISFAADVSLTSDGKVPGLPFQYLQGQIDQLNTKLQNIQLTPGPQGPAGPQGPVGPQGVQGPAGSAGFGGGMIVGTVNCGSTSGYLPVYILGESFSAQTTTAGAFRLSNVPDGTYDLTIDTPQSVHHTITGLSVANGMQISLGMIELCCADNFTSTCKCQDGLVNTGTKCDLPASPIPDCGNLETVLSSAVSSLIGNEIPSTSVSGSVLGISYTISYLGFALCSPSDPYAPPAAQATPPYDLYGCQNNLTLTLVPSTDVITLTVTIPNLFVDLSVSSPLTGTDPAYISATNVVVTLSAGLTTTSNGQKQIGNIVSSNLTYGSINFHSTDSTLDSFGTMSLLAPSLDYSIKQVFTQVVSTTQLPTCTL